MATRPTVNELATQLATMSEQITTLTVQMQTLTKRQRDPFWLRVWVDPPTHRAVPVATTNLATRLRYYERMVRLGVAAYYFVFGALYLRTGLGVALGSTISPALSIGAIRVIAATWYTFAGAGNLSCVHLAGLRYQLGMVPITVSAAAMMLILSASSLGSVPNTINTLLSMGFWLAMMVIHIGFGSTIRGRLENRDFTLSFAEAAEREQTGESQVSP